MIALPDTAVTTEPRDAWLDEANTLRAIERPDGTVMLYASESAHVCAILTLTPEKIDGLRTFLNEVWYRDRA